MQLQLEEIKFKSTKDRRHLQTINLLRHRILPFMSVYDAYKKPSNLKIEIYNDYINKIEIIAKDLELSIADYGIIFANTYTFTIAAILKDEETEYYLYITKDNIYLYEYDYYTGVWYAKL